MKQIIEIEVPIGKKAVWKNNTIVFEDIKLPKTYEEFCKNNAKHIKCLESKQYFALMQLHQLRDCYRQGWIPDGNIRKWCITSYENSHTIVPTEKYNYFLSFQTKEIAKKFLDNFENLIIQAGDLI